MSNRSKSPSSRKKRSRTAERHPRELRIDKIEEAVQDGLNEPYLNPKTKCSKMLRFNVGSPVVAAQKSLFHSATIVTYGNLAAPDSLFPKCSTITSVPVDRRVPTVRVHYDGWQKSDDSWSCENELFTAMFPCRPVDTLALLMAHEWNLIRCDQLNVPHDKLGVNAFIMSDDMYRLLEMAWQKDTDETLSFGQYCGRLPGPYYSSRPIQECSSAVTRE